MKKKVHPRCVRLGYAACFTLILGLASVSPVKAGTFGGRAFSAFVNVPSLGAGPVYVSDTGQLGPDGGWQGAELAGTQIPTVLSADVLVAATSGAAYDTGVQADSSTSFANVIILPGNPGQVTSSFVRAQAQVTASGVRGSSEIYDLTFGGVPVAVTGQPNQTVVIPGVATLTINEQTTSSGAITVNALHLVLVGGGEVIVSSATSSIVF